MLVPGRAVVVDAPQGCSVLDVATLAFPNHDLSSMVVFHDGADLSPEQAAVTELSARTEISAKPVLLVWSITGHIPTPKLLPTIKYLEDLGFTRSRGEENQIRFTSPNGQVITLNPDNRDSEHLDLSSATRLANALGMALADLTSKL